MSRTVAIIQARLRSSRLPGKVLYELAGRPMIAVMVERVRRAAGIDQIVLATGAKPDNDPLATIAERLGLPVYRGPEEDVLARYAGAAAAHCADIVVRLTADCPLADPEVIGAVIEKRATEGLDYCTNVKPPSWPDGLDVSVFTRALLDQAAVAAKLELEREHVVPWMWANVSFDGHGPLSGGNLPCPEHLLDERWTVDNAKDYLMLRGLAEKLGSDGLVQADWRRILDVLRANPELRKINAGGVRDEALLKAVS